MRAAGVQEECKEGTGQTSGWQAKVIHFQSAPVPSGPTAEGIMNKYRCEYDP